MEPCFPGNEKFWLQDLGIRCRSCWSDRKWDVYLFLCIPEECTHKDLFFKQSKTFHLHPHLHLKKIKSEDAQKLELFNPADSGVGAGWISVLGYEWAQAAMPNDVCTEACGHIGIYLFLCLSKSFLCNGKDISLHCHQIVSSCEKARELDLMGIAENTELAVFLQIPGRAGCELATQAAIAGRMARALSPPWPHRLLHLPSLLCPCLLDTGLFMLSQILGWIFLWEDQNVNDCIFLRKSSFWWA